MNPIWICEFCGAIHHIDDVDPDWAVHGCPACGD